MRTPIPAAMSTGEAAAYLGRSVKTLQRWDRDGTLSPAGRTGTGRRAYTKEQLDAFLGRKTERQAPSRIIAYCRVSSAAQQPDLKNQRRVLEEFAAARGLADVEWIEEVGGGLNFNRKRFLEIMDAVGRREVGTIVLAHKDRLVRFGYQWFEHHCKTHGCELLVLNNESLSPEQEMVQDLMTIVHTFSSRLYGLRNYKKKLSEALAQDVKP
jgi:excisionase family DNA binding protein